MRRGRCSRCRPPRRRRVLLLLLFRRQESTEGKTDQEYGTENLRHGRLDGGVVARHRPFFSEAFRVVFLSLLQWGNLHFNLKHTTEATKEQPYHGSGVRERFRGRGESPPPTEEGEGGILRFRGIYYVYLLFSFFFFFFVALSSSLLLLFLEERFVCVGG